MRTIATTLQATAALQCGFGAMTKPTEVRKATALADSLNRLKLDWWTSKP